jgi:hypothetical protein
MSNAIARLSQLVAWVAAFARLRRPLNTLQVMSGSPIWIPIVLVLAAVITAVWIGVLGFGLVRLIERVI